MTGKRLRDDDGRVADDENDVALGDLKVEDYPGTRRVVDWYCNMSLLVW